MKITNHKTENENYISYTNELYQPHREDGPAFEYISGLYKGSKSWYINGNLHRLDGPAIECPDGIKLWYFQGKYIKCKTQEEFERIIKLAILF